MICQSSRDNPTFKKNSDGNPHQFSGGDWAFWREWFVVNYPDQYEDIQSRTSPKQGSLSAIYRIFDIDHKDYQHSQKRGVCVLPLYHNWREFLCAEIKGKDLEPKISDWQNCWQLARDLRNWRSCKVDRQTKKPLQARSGTWRTKLQITPATRTMLSALKTIAA